VLIGGGLLDGSAHAAPGASADERYTPSAAQLQVLRNQNEIHEVIDPLLDGLDPTRLSKIPGYAGVVIDPVRNHFTLYWKGAAPDYITAALANLPAGMTAEVLPALRSRGGTQRSGRTDPAR
jgi:hypothetical protein